MISASRDQNGFVSTRKLSHFCRLFLSNSVKRMSRRARTRRRLRAGQFAPGAGRWRPRESVQLSHLWLLLPGEQLVRIQMCDQTFLPMSTPYISPARSKTTSCSSSPITRVSIISPRTSFYLWPHSTRMSPQCLPRRRAVPRPHAHRGTAPRGNHLTRAGLAFTCLDA